MTTRLSQFNNTGLPLPIGATFTGLFERTLTGLEISTFVNSSGLSLVTIEQSIDASNVRITTTFNYDPVNDVSTFSVPVALPFFRVKLHNGDIVDQAYLTLNTYVINTPPQQVNVNAGDITVSGTVAVSSVAGIVDISGNVVSTPATSAAQLRHTPLVVGHWYQVASVGDTIGAVWSEMGAIWDGEGLPPVGRQFQCLYAGYGTGTCYDITAPIDATSTTLPTLSYDQSAVGSLVAPQQLIGCKLMGVASTLTHEEAWCNDGGAIPVFGTVGIDTGNNTVKLDPLHNAITGTVSLTDPTSVRIRDSYGDVITTTSGNLMVGISNIYTANPLHTILDSGTVDLSTSANTVKIDQTSVSTNGVRTIAPDISSVRVTTASSTGVKVIEGGHLLSFLAVNLSATADTYVKLYDSVAAPVPASDAPLLIAHVSRDAAARLPSTQVDTSNLKITNKLWVRAVTGSADNNTDVTGLSMDICFFVTAT